MIGGLAAWALVRAAGLDLASPLVQLISYTPYVAVLSVLVLVAAVGVRRWREAVVAGLVVVAFGGFVVPRAVALPGAEGGHGGSLVVMSVNVLGGGADPARVVELVRREKPDVLSVQELTDEMVARLDAAGLAGALPHRALRPRPGASGTGLYAAHPLAGAGGLDTRSTFDLARATLKLPRRDTHVDADVGVVAVHTSPPLPGGPTGRWQRDFELLPRATGNGRLRVLAGDFNATLDHRELRSLLGSGYTDAAAAAGDGLVWTWPHGRGLPPVTIDHVLVDKRAGVRRVDVFDVAGSDHRAVVAHLRLPG